MTHWSMLTLVGEDQPGIVARVTRVLYEAGCHLGEASMMRLGGSFTIMMIVASEITPDDLRQALIDTAAALNLRIHVDPVSGGQHRHLVPNVQVRVNGADRAGIVAEVTGALASCNFNILELESDVAGDPAQPLYIMSIQGYSGATIEALRAAVAGLAAAGIDVDVSPVETLIG